MFLKILRCRSFKTFALFMVAWFVILIYSSTYLIASDSSPPEVSISNPKVESPEGKFQEVEKDEAVYTVSTYFDNGTGTPVIRIMGAGSLRLLELGRVTCEFYDDSFRYFKNIRGWPSMLYVKIEMELQGIWIKCPIPENPKQPNFVSISGSSTSFQELPAPSLKSYVMAFCIQPFFNNWENPSALMEWIELHKMLGVEHFTFYNQSLGEKSAKVLDSYGDVVTLLPWDLGFDTALAQDKAQKDCMYRHMGVAEIVGFVDLDEFMAPSWLTRFGGQGFPEYYDMFMNIGKKYSARHRKVSGIGFESKFAFDQFLEMKGSLSLYLTNEMEFDLIPLGTNFANRLQILTHIHFHTPFN